MICHWSLIAEQYFGVPQDLEWAVDEGVVSILQSRPITALPAIDEREVGGPYVIYKPAV
jgi:phosphoenolpyruvate synthase/pyruvate phosphate dikinase